MDIHRGSLNRDPSLQSDGYRCPQLDGTGKHLAEKRLRGLLPSPGVMRKNRGLGLLWCQQTKVHSFFLRWTRKLKTKSKKQEWECSISPLGQSHHRHHSKCPSLNPCITLTQPAPFAPWQVRRIGIFSLLSHPQPRLHFPSQSQHKGGRESMRNKARKSKYCRAYEKSLSHTPRACCACMVYGLLLFAFSFYPYHAWHARLPCLCLPSYVVKREKSEQGPLLW